MKRPIDRREVGASSGRTACLGLHRELPGLSLTEVHYDPEFAMDRHAHATAYLTVTLRGGYTEQLDGTSRVCEVGSVVFRPAGEPHASRFNGEASRCLRLQFSDDWLAQRAGGIALPGHSIGVSGRRANWLALQLYDEFMTWDGASSLAIEGLTLALLADLGRPVRDGRAPAWLLRVLDRIQEDFRGPLSLADLASTAGVHPVHLARTFRRHRGTTVAAYVRDLRLEWCLRQLGTGERPLAEIAQLAGFADQSHFARTFKKRTGLTPARYRERARR